MKSRLLFASLVLALAGVAPVLVSAQTAGNADETTPLGEKMDGLNKAFRQLRKQAGDAAQNASSLELVAKIRAAANESEELIPAKAQELPEKDRPAFVAAYKAKMKEFEEMLVKLETSLKAGDNAAATKLVAALGDLQKSSHKDFRLQKKD